MTKEEFLNYYNQGLNDQEIADILDLKKSTIGTFRRNLRLSPNYEIDKYRQQIIDLYNEGLNDKEIAEQLGIEAPRISKYRNKKLNLPAQERASIDLNELTNLFNQGLTDQEIADKMGHHLSWIKRNRLKLKLYRGE